MNKKNKLRIIGAFLALTAVLFVTGCGFKADQPRRYAIKLEIWGLFDDSDAFYAIFDVYRKANPNVVEINYKKLTPDTYKKELVEALASGQGPDIFLIQNTWLPGFIDKITPAAQEIISEQKFRNDFVDVAAADFINQGKIYAVPLSVDSLALYYNKDLFNQAGITSPPSNWNDFVTDVQKLTKVDSYGQIIQSGAAIGTAKNINRSTDILNLLMLQNNTQMTDDRWTRALFDQAAQTGTDNKTVYPAVDALNFYTQFAKANSTFYCWNSNMHYSTDAFSENNLAMMINYSWQIKALAGKSPKLNYAIAPVPQLNPAQPVNFPNYWAFAVSKNKIAVTLPNRPAVPDEDRVAEAWNFLNFLAMKPEAFEGQAAAQIFDPAADYLQKTNNPAARKDLIEKQKGDVKLGVFAEGNLIAKDWIQPDSDAVEGIFAEMIDSVNKGSAAPMDAVKTAAAQVTQRMGSR